jgi:hypothetical protein
LAGKSKTLSKDLDLDETIEFFLASLKQTKLLLGFAKIELLHENVESQDFLFFVGQII